VIVVDASVLTSGLIYADERGRTSRVALGRDTEWAAPEHWKAEVFAAIRGLAIGHKISPDQAVRAITQLPHLGIDHVSLDPLLGRMWQLRNGDRRLARAATAYCRVELVHP